MENALIPKDEEAKKLLQKAKQESSGGNRLPPIPQIKMCNVKGTKIPNVQLGEYYIEESEYDADKGERMKKYTPLGANPDIVIIKKRMSYSYYSKDADRLIGWTNELDGFSPDQKVYIAFNDGNSPSIIAEFTKSEFKHAKLAAKNKKANADEMTRVETILANLKYRNILYVYLPETGKGYRMFVSNASGTGVPDGEAQHGSFDEPQEGSLTEFMNKVTSQEPEVPFKVVCKLGSRGKLGAPTMDPVTNEEKAELEYYLMTFTIDGELPYETFMEMLNNWNALNDELEIRHQTEFMSFGSSEPSKHEVQDVEDIEF